MFFTSRQKEIESLLRDYFRHSLGAVENLLHALKEYGATNDRGRLVENFSRVDRAESSADDVRREIEVLLYSKALFPESRGDILGLIETIDKVPNQAEAAAAMMISHHVAFPEQIKPRVIELGEISLRCTEALVEGASKLFSDFTAATVAVGRVDELESKADVLENSLIEQVFTSEYPDLQKIVLRDIIGVLASICDRAENAADRIRLIVAKRSI